MDKNLDSPLFLLGRIVVTPKALELTTDQERDEFLYRHQLGKWDETNPALREQNLTAVKNDSRIISIHRSKRAKIMVTTNGDRSTTTILLVHE